eukprot:m.310270 g.310270  ORF g.310270 m.310270 type:complete len:226 (+) comp50568_c0_seq1:245-922(+)
MASSSGLGQSRTKADLKVVILGDVAVGKTCFIQRYLKGTFAPEQSTIGAAFSIKNWNGFNVAIWDTAGEEKFRALSSFYCRDASAAILAYDITRAESLETLQKDLLPLLNRAKPNCLVVVVAMKVDLIGTEPREVKPEQGLEVAKAENLLRNTYFRANEDDVKNSFFETSAKTGENVMEVFDFLQKMLLPSMMQKKEVEEEDKDIITVTEQTDSRKSAKGKSGCC